jgi:hypothetical protein
MADRPLRSGPFRCLWLRHERETGTAAGIAGRRHVRPRRGTSAAVGRCGPAAADVRDVATPVGGSGTAGIGSRGRAIAVSIPCAPPHRHVADPLPRSVRHVLDDAEIARKPQYHARQVESVRLLTHGAVVAGASRQSPDTWTRTPRVRTFDLGRHETFATRNGRQVDVLELPVDLR